MGDEYFYDEGTSAPANTTGNGTGLLDSLFNFANKAGNGLLDYQKSKINLDAEQARRDAEIAALNRQNNTTPAVLGGSLVPGVSNKTLMIVGAAVVGGIVLLLVVRKK